MSTPVSAVRARHSPIGGAVLIAILLALAGCSGASTSGGAPTPTRHLGPQGRVGQFVVECGHSHSAPDDPIVHPGRPGRSHMHDFFGNVTTDAASDLDSLLEGSTTCRNPRDTAAYWAPMLLADGAPVEPVTSVAYYRVAPGVEPTAVRAFPPDLRMISGDMTRSEPQPVDIAGWGCGVSTRLSAAPPDCPASAQLRAVVTFPDCWDGTRIDSDDHTAHMANSSGGTCPSSHPVHVPQLTFAIEYPISGPGHRLSLSSGSVHGLHADFVNAWDQDALENEVRACLQRDAVCGLASNRAASPLFGS